MREEYLDALDELHDVQDVKRQYLKAFRLNPNPTNEDMKQLERDLSGCDELEKSVKSRVDAALSEILKEEYSVTRTQLIMRFAGRLHIGAETAKDLFELTWEDKFQWVWENGERNLDEIEQAVFHKSGPDGKR